MIPSLRQENLERGKEMATTIFYLSAPGNSLQAAKDLAAHLGDTELISIPSVIDKEVELRTECAGIVYPVHVFGRPIKIFGLMRIVTAAGSARKYARSMISVWWTTNPVAPSLRAMLRLY